MPRRRRSKRTGRRRQKQGVNLRREKERRQALLPPLVATSTGVLIRGAKGSPPAAFSKIRVTYGELSLPYEATLIWKPGMAISLEEIKRGFTRLLSREDTYQAWEMLAMLVDQNLLASSVGSRVEKAQTLKEVGDLRLPVYDTRVLWVRRTEATKRVIARWAKELKRGADEQHAFLRALYKERAMLCTLPPGWHKV